MKSGTLGARIPTIGEQGDYTTYISLYASIGVGIIELKKNKFEPLSRVSCFLALSPTKLLNYLPDAGNKK